MTSLYAESIPSLAYALETIFEHIFKLEHTCSFVVLLAHLPALNKIVDSVNNTLFVFGENSTTLSMVLLLKLFLNCQSLENINSRTEDPIHSKCMDVEKNLDVPCKEEEDEDEAIEEEEENEGKHCNMKGLTSVTYQ